MSMQSPSASETPPVLDPQGGAPQPQPDPETPKNDAMREVAKVAEKDVDILSAETVADATDWFLAEDPEEEVIATFEINVGVAKEKWVRWTVKAIDRDRIRDLRKSASGNRAARRAGGEPDEMEVNRRIAVDGTVSPNLADERLRTFQVPDGEGTRTHNFIDPADALSYRFRHKPGLIDQIAAKVLSVSGYDDEDIREVAAAGN